jgi:uncharacterized protein YggE
MQLRLDWRVISASLVVIIGVMLAIWQPWHSTSATKTITVRGEATVEHAPDLFTFYATYQDTDNDKLAAKGNSVVAGLKALGVKAADIKTNVSASSGANGKELLLYPRPIDSSTYTITATVGTQTLAQKVTDYFATTGATGQVTPQTGFTKTTTTALSLDARRKASADAKSKAEVVAGQFGAKLGRVTKITEDSGYAYPVAYGAADSAKSTAQSSTPVVEPGTNEVSYSFTVVFELR